MDDSAKKIDAQMLLSFADDLVKVLKDEKGIYNWIESIEAEKSLRSSFKADSSEIHDLIEDYQKRINACKQNLDAAKSDVAADKELESLEIELEEELQRERLLLQGLRIVSDEIADLEHRRISIEEQKTVLQKVEKDELRAQKKLSMYASVTNIIPDLDDQTRISGHIVERDKKMVEKFEFEPSETSSIEICNSLWKMLDL